MCKHFYTVLHLPKAFKIGAAGPYRRPDITSCVLLLQLYRFKGIHIHTVALPTGIVYVNNGQCGLSIARSVPIVYSDIAFVGQLGPPTPVDGMTGSPKTPPNNGTEIHGGNLIVTGEAHNVSFSNIQFYNRSGNGLDVTNAARVTVHGCTFANCSRAGIKAHHGGSVHIDSCHFDNNKGSGVRVSGDSTTGVLRNCSFVHNLHGINAENGCQVEVYGGAHFAFLNNKKFGIYAMLSNTVVKVRNVNEEGFASCCGGNGGSFDGASLERKMDRDFTGNWKGEWGAHIYFEEECSGGDGGVVVQSVEEKV